MAAMATVQATTVALAGASSSRNVGSSSSSSSCSSIVVFMPSRSNGMRMRGHRGVVAMSADSFVKDKPRSASKELAKDTLLTPRFYTTDFDEMERMFNKEINGNLNEEEFQSLVQEFKTDYNQTHFVRNPEFRAAAEKIQGPMRQIFVEFLERSCTAEFSGFLLYKELGRRLKVSQMVLRFRWSTSRPLVCLFVGIHVDQNGCSVVWV